MTPFLLSQICIAIAMCFDVMTFQFKQRKHVVYCLVSANILIGLHFFLLEQWTAVLLMAIAALRNTVSLYLNSRRIMFGFIGLTLIATAMTYQNALSLLAGAAALLPNIAMFSGSDKRMRILLMVSTCIWILHNSLASSPMAILMEVLFLAGNLVGYYRFYLRGDRRLA
ncbi:YgjV family protein [Rhodobacteraceae bacterium CH30]|nr:YgjV family protein [Rhodobacteraceae bacterium CH30]